ncbi:MAG: hypothetical protein R3C68_16130 [Myxococcota bacterium]
MRDMPKHIEPRWLLHAIGWCTAGAIILATTEMFWMSVLAAVGALATALPPERRALGWIAQLICIAAMMTAGPLVWLGLPFVVAAWFVEVSAADDRQPGWLRSVGAALAAMVLALAVWSSGFWTSMNTHMRGEIIEVAYTHSVLGLLHKGETDRAIAMLQTSLSSHMMSYCVARGSDEGFLRIVGIEPDAVEALARRHTKNVIAYDEVQGFLGDDDTDTYLKQCAAEVAARQ